MEEIFEDQTSSELMPLPADEAIILLGLKLPGKLHVDPMALEDPQKFCLQKAAMVSAYGGACMWIAKHEIDELNDLPLTSARPFFITGGSNVTVNGETYNEATEMARYVLHHFPQIEGSLIVEPDSKTTDQNILNIAPKIFRLIDNRKLVQNARLTVVTRSDHAPRSRFLFEEFAVKAGLRVRIMDELEVAQGAYQNFLDRPLDTAAKFRVPHMSQTIGTKIDRTIWPGPLELILNRAYRSPKLRDFINKGVEPTRG